MFTIKLYRGMSRQRILAADSFTILRGNGDAEITLHRKSGEDVRYDISQAEQMANSPVDQYDKAIIENAAGRTTEIIMASPALNDPPR